MGMSRLFCVHKPDLDWKLYEIDGNKTMANKKQRSDALSLCDPHWIKWEINIWFEFIYFTHINTQKRQTNSITFTYNALRYHSFEILYQSTAGGARPQYFDSSQYNVNWSASRAHGCLFFVHYIRKYALLLNFCACLSFFELHHFQCFYFCRHTSDLCNISSSIRLNSIFLTSDVYSIT